MNIKISAITNSVMLVTVMPRNSRSILFLNRQTHSGRTGVGGRLENGTQYPDQVYSEVNTLLTIDASGRCGQGVEVRKTPFLSAIYRTASRVLYHLLGKCD